MAFEPLIIDNYRKLPPALINQRVISELLGSHKIFVECAKKYFAPMQNKPLALTGIETFEDFLGACAYGFVPQETSHRQALYQFMQKHPTVFCGLINRIIINSCSEQDLEQTVNSHLFDDPKNLEWLDEEEKTPSQEEQRLKAKVALITTKAAAKIAEIFRNEKYVLEFLRIYPFQFSAETLRVLAENHLSVAKYILSTPVLSAILDCDPTARYRIYSKHPFSLWLANQVLQTTGVAESKEQIRPEIFATQVQLTQEKNALLRKAALLSSYQQTLAKQKELTEKLAQIGTQNRVIAAYIHEQLAETKAHLAELQVAIQIGEGLSHLPITLNTMVEQRLEIIEGRLAEIALETKTSLPQFQKSLPALLGYLASRNPQSLESRQRALDVFLIPATEYSSSLQQCWENWFDLIKMSPKYAELVDAQHIAALFELKEIKEKLSNFRAAVHYVIRHNAPVLWQVVFNKPDNFARYISSITNPLVFLKKHADQISGLHLLVALPALYKTGITNEELTAYLTKPCLERLRKEIQRCINSSPIDFATNLRLIAALHDRRILQAIKFSKEDLATWLKNSNYSFPVCEFVAKNSYLPNSLLPDLAGINIHPLSSPYLRAATHIKNNIASRGGESFVTQFVAGQIKSVLTPDNNLDQTICALIAHGPLWQHIIPKTKPLFGFATSIKVKCSEKEIRAKEDALLQKKLSPFFAHRIQYDRETRNKITVGETKSHNNFFAAATSTQLWELAFNLYCHPETWQAQSQIRDVLVTKLAQEKLSSLKAFISKADTFLASYDEKSIVDIRKSDFIKDTTCALIDVLMTPQQDEDEKAEANALLKCREIWQSEKLRAVAMAHRSDFQNVSINVRAVRQFRSDRNGMATLLLDQKSAASHHTDLEWTPTAPEETTPTSYSSPSLQLLSDSPVLSPGLVEESNGTPSVAESPAMALSASARSPGSQLTRS